jgi:O-antigen/teichoic acid export membrane protein
MAMAPVMAGMAVAAPCIVSSLYGKAWLGASAPLQVFCLVGMFRVLGMPAGAVSHASGHVYAELRRQIVYAALVLVGAAVGSRWGLTGVACGVAIAILYKYVAMGSLSLRICGSTWREYVMAQVPGIMVAMFVGGVALLVRYTLEARHAGSVTILIAIIAACAPAAIVGVYLLPRRVRPSALFERLEQSAATLPTLLRRPVTWAIRCHA